MISLYRWSVSVLCASLLLLPMLTHAQRLYRSDIVQQKLAFDTNDQWAQPRKINTQPSHIPMDINGDTYMDVVSGFGEYVAFGSAEGTFDSDRFVNADADQPLLYGDVNGDGEVDLVDHHGIIFSFFEQDVQENMSAYTYDAQWVFSHPDWFVMVQSVIDLNGDGMDDVLIATHGGNADYYSSDVENVLVLGSAEFSSVIIIEDVAVEISSDDARMNSVVSLGDVNGDGYTDIAVEREKVIFGGADIAETIAEQFANPSVMKSSAYHYAVVFAPLGDINNDGFDDIALVRYRKGSDAAYRHGIVNVYLGSSDFEQKGELRGRNANVRYFGTEPRQKLGVGTSGVGDVNGDGYDDFVMGSFWNNHQHLAAIIVYGSDELDLDSSIKVTVQKQDFEYVYLRNRLEDDRRAGDVAMIVNPLGNVDDDAAMEFAIDDRQHTRIFDLQQ